MVMPFGLKNARATCQRMMIRMFRDKIGITVEVYTDDMDVKIWENRKHVEDLMKAFEIFRWHKLCLNADKCAFGMRAGKFLRYMITHQGIEANPD